LAVEICKKYNLSAAIINISGNVYVYKSKPISNEQVTKWTVGIDMPIESKDKFCALKLDDISIVTSGDYNRFFIYDGTKYAHILNPKTGYPLNIIRNHQTPEGENPDKYYEEGLISVTIINKNSELADIYAKIVMLLGMENGVKYMIQNNLSGVLISNDMRYAAVGELEQMDINGANGYKEYEPYVDNNGVEYSF
jgi:thiamine biosynthesis lipoprotein